MKNLQQIGAEIVILQSLPIRIYKGEMTRAL